MGTACGVATPQYVYLQLLQDPDANREIIPTSLYRIHRIIPPWNPVSHLGVMRVEITTQSDNVGLTSKCPKKITLAAKFDRDSVLAESAKSARDAGQPVLYF